ncbi:alpha/beta fold hydrolase [Polyangium aurulentum]|uniref:alpha/beta fold hydrolase n=1 Tax=Polyangium aurulentum TaxID=2567896 RepID=UPI0010ADFB2E|nr:alpha/beta fold hydrolase [Polyangium aurulentum]UQA54869.1 alpha/beta hydrolase [Polyangium aurulentum]
MLPPRLPLAVETRTVQSHDGARVAYHVTKAPFPGAPVVVLANGLGGHHKAWWGQIEHLEGRYRLITWDYRGLYASGRPSPDTAAGYAIPHHARDLFAILQAEGVERAGLVGWSMGVQVVLEAYRMNPDLASSLVLLNGTYGRPLDTLIPLPGVKSVMPSLVELCRRAHAIATQLTRKAAGMPEALAWLKAAGMMSETFDDAVFAELVHGFGGLDMEAFFHNLRALGEHDASAVLDTVRVPTLVVAGDRDALTSPALAQKIAERVPGAELLVVRGGTHYTAVEFPELVSLRMAKFYRENGL